MRKCQIITICVLCLLSLGITSVRAAELVSVNDPETAVGDRRSGSPAVSLDGLYVAFASDASNLGSLDTNNRTDIYLRDRLARTTILISKSAKRPLDSADGNSLNPQISEDGSVVVFESDANDLVETDTNSARDIFVWKRSTGKVSLVSLNRDKTNSGNGLSGDFMLTPDGQFVVFESTATNLEFFSNSASRNVYRRNLKTESTELVSVNLIGNGTGSGAGNATSFSPLITPNGRYVVFLSNATNLTPPPLSVGGLFVRDMDQAKTNSSMSTAMETGVAAAFPHMIILLVITVSSSSS